MMYILRKFVSLYMYQSVLELQFPSSDSFVKVYPNIRDGDGNLCKVFMSAIHCSHILSNSVRPRSLIPLPRTTFAAQNSANLAFITSFSLPMTWRTS